MKRKTKPVALHRHDTSGFTELLSRLTGDVSDRLREAAQVADAAERLANEGDVRTSVELLIEEMPAIVEALTLVRLLACEAIRSHLFHQSSA